MIRPHSTPPFVVPEIPALQVDLSANRPEYPCIFGTAYEFLIALNCQCVTSSASQSTILAVHDGSSVTYISVTFLPGSMVTFVASTSSGALAGTWTTNVPGTGTWFNLLISGYLPSSGDGVFHAYADDTSLGSVTWVSSNGPISVPASVAALSPPASATGGHVMKYRRAQLYLGVSQDITQEKVRRKFFDDSFTPVPVRLNGVRPILSFGDGLMAAAANRGEQYGSAARDVGFVGSIADTTV